LELDYSWPLHFTGKKDWSAGYDLLVRGTAEAKMDKRTARPCHSSFKTMTNSEARFMDKHIANCSEKH